MAEALEITVTSESASFRDPLYSGVQNTLPCPPPSTVRGLLAAMVGGPGHLPESTRFAMSFTARGSGTDLETYHRLNPKKKEKPMVTDRQFLADVSLTVWVMRDLPLWEKAVRRPVWPLRLGRSQDLAAARCRRVTLKTGPGRQGGSLVPSDLSRSGMRLRMPSLISADRSHTVWGDYRYAPHGSPHEVEGALCTQQGEAVVLLDPEDPETRSICGEE